MKSVMTKTLLKVAAVLLTSIALLGCPSDDDDETSSVTVTNSAGFLIDTINIHVDGTAIGTSFGTIADGTSATYAGYDCTLSYVADVTGNAMAATSAPFIPPCDGVHTITFVVGDFA